MAVGTWHALANAGVGARPLVLGQHAACGWIRPRGARDTFFRDWPARRRRPGGTRPPVHRLAIRALRSVGHYDGTPPQAEALRVSDPARGRAPAGMDTAILAYSGISVKMLVDRVFGADLLTMFTVDYEPGGAAQVHDHPFEETYFFLDGEIEGVLDGEEVHASRGRCRRSPASARPTASSTPASGRVRWIETQAPQPPARHAYRWVDAWKRYEEE